MKSERKFIAPGQWIESCPDGPTPGVTYYDGVHRGFCSATTAETLRDATAAEMSAAAAEALAICRVCRAYANR